MMRGILIDPAAKTVESVDHNGDYKDILRLIGDPPDGFACYMLAPDVAMYVDDLGVYRANQSYFALTGYPHLIPGKTLLLGVGHDGISVSVRLTPEKVRANTRFFAVQPVFKEITQTEASATILGRAGVEIVQTAHFDPPGVEEKQ